VLTGATNKKAEATTPCLPHTFAAMVQATDAATLRDAVLKAVGDEWKKIAAKVKAALDPVFRAADPKWDENNGTPVGRPSPAAR